MKNKIIPIFLALSALCGCLKENPKSYDTARNYYKSAVQIQTGINGCYSPLRTILASRGFWFMCEMDTDLCYCQSNTNYDANCGVSPSKPGIASTVWQNGYLGVMRCNEILEDIAYSVEKGYVSGSEAEPYIAEAVVLRSLFYYLLTCTFGDVPYYEQKVTEENRAQIAALPRMSADATRDRCTEALYEYIIERGALPMQRTYDNESYRIGAAAGLMVGAKMCMWNKRWRDAAEFISVLETIYGNYSDRQYDFGADYPLCDVPFSVRYARESILELSNRVEPYGIQVSGLIASASMPRRETGDVSDGNGEDDNEEDAGSDKFSDIYSGIVIPELGGYARTNTAARPTSYFYQQLLGYYSGDMRSGEYTNTNAARGGSGTLAWRWYGFDAKNDPGRTERKIMFFSGLSASSRPWLGNKFWAWGMYDSKDPNNYKFLRFADAILMKAEAYAMDGQYDNACKYLNITRTRAGLESVRFSGFGSSPEILLEEIRRERARELIGEYQRKFDLVRWGIWYERTLAYNEDKFLQNNIRPYHRYWPIPADQVAYSNYALDNNEYKED